MARRQQKRTRKTGASSSPSRRRGDLHEDLYRFSANVADAPLATTYPTSKSGKTKAPVRNQRDEDVGDRLTRYEERSVARSRIVHLFQFLALLGVLIGLVLWLAYYSSLYL